jgi:SAM-dependent methyltransferase
MNRALTNGSPAVRFRVSCRRHRDRTLADLRLNRRSRWTHSMDEHFLLQRFRHSKLAYYLRRIKKSITAGDCTYDPNRYWTDQLGHFGSDLRGPGKGGLSEQENAELYRHGEQALERLTRRLMINWRGRFGEIGPGNGYWLNWLTQHGVIDYTGFDITDVLFPLIHETWPNARLIRHDVTTGPLPDDFDVLLMIDVTQHIMDERSFRRAMTNCRTAIKPGGHFLVTSWLRPYQKISYMEVMRPLIYYTKPFKGWRLTGPIIFRDKSLLAFTAPLH